MEKLVLASNNNHKIKEFKEMFPNFEILSLKDIGFFNDIDENGTTAFENAYIKAKTAFDYLKKQNISISVVADDSGLFVESLNGEPGINSARYSGEHGNDQKNREKLLKKLEGNKNRDAYFYCVLVEIFPNGEYGFVEGKTYGKILEKEEGDKSFGYDCLFYSNELGKSFGLATSKEKNSVSHRGRAIKNLKEMLQSR